MKIELKDKPKIGEYFRGIFYIIFLYTIFSLLIELTLSYFRIGDVFSLGYYFLFIFVGTIAMAIIFFFSTIVNEPKFRIRCMRCRRLSYDDEMIKVSKIVKNLDYIENYIHKKCLDELK